MQREDKKIVYVFPLVNSFSNVDKNEPARLTPDERMTG